MKSPQDTGKDIRIPGCGLSYRDVRSMFEA